MTRNSCSNLISSMLRLPILDAAGWRKVCIPQFRPGYSLNLTQILAKIVQIVSPKRLQCSQPSYRVSMFSVIGQTCVAAGLKTKCVKWDVMHDN
jgi:hypothetical protein